MGKQKLNPKIFAKLKKKYPKKTDNAIQVKLSKLSRKHNVTLNAAAEIWAKEKGFSVWGLLNDKDRESLKDKYFQTITIRKKEQKSGRKIINFIDYQTNNKFLKAHIDEINRCYTCSCYTAAFILTRKVIENLITDMVKRKLPNKTKEDRGLYLDLSKGRIHDLSILIKNFRKKASNFYPDEKKLILRILQLAEEFKDDANDKTHSLYHISSKKELEGKNPQVILDLIKEFFEKY